MKKILVLLSLALVAVAIAAPSSAAAAAGKLDQSFGHDGRVTIALPVHEQELAYPQKPRAARMAMDVLPGGGFAAADNLFVVERRQDGSALRSFGKDGKLALVPPIGWKFELADLAVDEEGRVLVAGTFASLTTSAIQDPPQYDEGRGANGPRLRMGVVFRFLPKGALDPAFGTGGTVYGDFRQSPPTGPGPYDFAYSLPAVGLTGLALARDGGIVVSGYSAEHVTGGCAPPLPGATGRSFVARLRSDGSFESGFGSNGVLTLPGVERPSPPALSPSGGIAFDGASGYCWPRGPEESGQLFALQASGRLDPGFGSNGARPHPSLQKVTALAFDSRGRLLVLGRRPETAELEGGVGNPEWRIRRLLVDGKPDPTFGRNGSSSPLLPPQAHLEDLAIDRHGRIALAGFRTDAWGMNTRFLVTRLSGSGRRESRFGQNGWVVTRFPGSEAAAIALRAGKSDHLLVGGIMGDPRFEESKGLAFARYSGR